ncbi:short-chain dehydrogenase/reductase family protein [Favolaschia claudopus]|uniref:Short-chain dehydrogenase/reductase family protein n=1 Tax=Favolaschia claudopus TaxID=2862362 RepID=A0AAW0CGJ2_9AGAR
MSTPIFKFTFHTTAEEVATAFADEIKGKNVLITGTSVGGIGFETARVMALKSANLVIITGHNAERLKIAEETLKKESPSANIRPLILDLSSLASVRKAAAEVNAMPEALHVVIHNAAAVPGPFKLTLDNLENQIVTNHISPFLFTKLVAPKILATHTAQYTPRVVLVSAAGHAFCDGVDFNQMEKPDPANHVGGMDAYFRTKCMNILFGIELSKRSKGQINAYSLHPGVIDTNIMHKGDVPAGLKKLELTDQSGLPSNLKYAWKTIPQGAASTVAAAFDPSLNDKPGAYLDDSVAANDKIAPHAADPANAEKLWIVSERIIGESFTF